MPCAFPPWGQTKKVQSNDRVRILQLAQQKNQQKQDKLEAIAKRARMLKYSKKLRLRKAKKEKVQKEKEENLQYESELLDPNEIFDKQGNIQIFGFINQTKESSNTKEANISTESISIEKYRQEAAVHSDDSIDDSSKT